MQAQTYMLLGLQHAAVCQSMYEGNTNGRAKTSVRSSSMIMLDQPIEWYDGNDTQELYRNGLLQQIPATLRTLLQQGEHDIDTLRFWLGCGDLPSSCLIYN